MYRKHKTTILDGKLPLLVDGYCNSLGSEAENLATAKIRANRVKSELIIRAEIKRRISLPATMRLRVILSPCA